VGNALLLAGILVMYLREDWRMGLVFTVYCVISATLYNGMREVGTPY
jgi:hypothetical protein